MPARKLGDRPTRTRSSRPPGWLLPAGALLGIILLGALAAWVFRALQPTPQTTANNEPLLIQLDKPLVQLAATPTDVTSATTIDAAIGKQLIETWLSAKSKAMGSTHDLAALDQILADPKLAEWRGAADEAKRDGWYRTYKHEVTVESVELLSATGQMISPAAAASPAASAAPDPAIAPTASPAPAATASPAISSDPTSTASPTTTDAASPAPDLPTTAPTTPASPAAIADQARILANVTETTETFRDGKTAGAPQSEQLRVQYNLVRKDGKWRIQDWQLQ